MQFKIEQWGYFAVQISHLKGGIFHEKYALCECPPPHIDVIRGFHVEEILVTFRRRSQDMNNLLLRSKTQCIILQESETDIYQTRKEDNISEADKT